MTITQVRAATRRMRTEHDESGDAAEEINLVPYMDIVTNIIIFLLASVVNQVPLAAINASSPTISGELTREPDVAPDPPPLNLTVTVTADSFIIAASGATLPPIANRGPGHDFAALAAKLRTIKATYPGETRIFFSADAALPYDTVVRTLDTVREDGAGPLFPDVAFAAGIY
jgi:biopolymer transport protein ExbD